MVITGWLFSGFPAPEFANAAIGDIGHFRDSVGGQIPGTGFAGFNFNQQIRNDGIYTKPNNSTIQFTEAGSYLVISTIRGVDNSNGRYNAQARIALTAGTGNVFSSYYTGYSRDNSENTAWFRAVGVIINASANAQVQVQRRRDTDAPTSGSIANQSDVQVIRINPTNYGIYAIGGTGNAYGGTVPNTVDITANSFQSSTASIEGNTTTETVTIKGNNKKYLVAWSISGDTGGGRTQRIGHLEYSGTDELPTRSYCYQRNAANEYCGLGSMDLIQTGTIDIPIQLEIFRGTGIAADQGGADVDGSWQTDGNGQMVVLEMPDYFEAFRSHDSVGVQDVSSAQVLNIARDVDFNDPLSFTKSSNTTVDVTNPSDIFSWSNIWTARNNISSGARLTSFGAIAINGVEQAVGEHGSYSRGQQATTDTFGLSFHPAGIFTVGTAGHDISVNTSPLPGTEGGGNDRTQQNTLGFFALNLDTLIEPRLTQSAYRFFNNIDSVDVGAPFAPQDAAGILTFAGEPFRLRSLINVSDNQLRQNEASLKLQFAQKVGICDPTFTDEIYTDVTGSSLIAYNNNASSNDGSNLIANPNDPINGLNVVVNQSYEELNNFTTSVSAIGRGQDGKWDFSLVDNGAPANTSYCFRIIRSDNSLLDIYNVIPEITTAITQTDSPGGVSSALNLWLRADSQVNNTGLTQALDGQNVENWQDQSPIDLDLVQLALDNRPIFRNNNLNFNPTVDFDGVNDFLENPDSPFTSARSDETNIFIVAFEDVRKTSSIFDFSGSTSQRFQAHYPWSDGVAYFDINGSTGASRVSAPVPFSVGEASIGGFVNSVANNNQEILVNAGSIASDNTGESTITTQTVIGSFAINAYGGQIAEFITYDNDLSPIEKQQVQSYLALKYGITLDQSVSLGGLNYLDSAGFSYWNQDINDIYEHDIFGLGRDDVTALDQKVSKSINSDGIITMALDNDFVSGNVDAVRSTTHVNDLQFLTLANDNSPLTLQTTEVDTRFQERIGREWKIQKTANFTQTTNLKFDGFNDDYNLLMDIDGDFSAGAVDLGQLDANGEITNIDLFNTQHITLAKNNVVIPQELLFNVFDADADNTVGFASLSNLNARFATNNELGTTTPTFSANLNASTNAINGYTIEIDGTNLVCTTCDPSGPFINGIGAATTASVPGTEQFGLRATSNGSASISAPYNDPANHAYGTSLFVDEIVTGTGDNILSNIPLEFIANINPLTPAGEYTATLTFTMHAEF